MAHTQPRKCSHTTASGAPCRAWAVHGSDPPACAAHGGTADPAPDPAADPGIVDVIADLAAKQEQLSRYIDECLDAKKPDAEILSLMVLHSQNAARLGRLLRDKQALLPRDDEQNEIIFRALDELGAEWGIDL